MRGILMSRSRRRVDLFADARVREAFIDKVGQLIRQYGRCDLVPDPAAAWNWQDILTEETLRSVCEEQGWSLTVSNDTVAIGGYPQ